MGWSEPAHAEHDVRALNVGAGIGFQLTAPDMDLLGDRSKVVHLSNAPWITLHAGYMVVAPYMALELNLAIVPLGIEESTQSGIALPTTLDIVIYPLTGVAEPYFAIGAGVNALVGGDLGTDADFLFGAALGLRVRPINELAVRAEIRLAVSDAVIEPLAANLIFAIGVDWLGLPVGGASGDNGGGTGASGGSQTGGDKRPGKCTPPDPKCTDTDGDGLFNADDACPDAAGAAKMKGCPDTDGDGVADFEDDCPIAPGSSASRGCSDQDGDGLHDGQDACPEDPGTAELQGCPDPNAMRLEDLSEPMPDIAFKRGTARLTSRANKFLRTVVTLLKAHPEVRLEIRVWTSGRGKRAKHQTLSAARAHAVVTALLERGIAAKRLRSAGQGKSKKGVAQVVLFRLATVRVLD